MGLTKEQKKTYIDKYRKNNVEKLKEYSKMYYIKNAEKIKKEKSLYRKKNRDKIIEASRHYNNANKEKAKLHMKEYRIKNKEHVNDYNRLRNAKIYDMNDNTINQKSLIGLLEYQNHKCKLCNINLNKVTKHLDHIMPLSKGGIHSIFNVQWLCDICNLSKNAKLPNQQLSIFNI